MEQKEFNDEKSIVAVKKASTNKTRPMRNMIQAVKKTPEAKAMLQTVRVTGGGFSRALEQFTKGWNIADATVLKLRRSPDFMKMARALDKKYVSQNDALKYDVSYDAGYRIKKGRRGMPASYKGKRVIYFNTITTGPNFQSLESNDNDLPGDVLTLENKFGIIFLQHLAHETCHAYNYNYSTSKAPKDLVEAIRADTQEEIGVRKREQKILNEINKGLKTKLKFKPVGSMVPAIVGRDFSPGLGLTYLENSFFAFRLRVLQKQEKLSEGQARAMRDKVSKNKGLPFMPHQDPKSGLFELSEYGKTWNDMLKAKKSWKAFFKSAKKNSSSAKEVRIQKHAKLFFRNLVRYSKLP